MKSKASIGIYFWSLVFNSHRPHITVAQHVIQSDSLLQNRVTWFYREDYCTPEERKPKVTPLPHTYSTHIKHNSVIKFSQIPAELRTHNWLLWAVQGCQDHNDSKLLFYSPLLQPPPHLKCSSVSVHFKSEEWGVSRRCQFVPACVSAAFRCIQKSITIRHEGECKYEAFGGFVICCSPSWHHTGRTSTLWILVFTTDTKTGCRSCFGSRWCSDHLHCQHKIQFCKSPRERSSCTQHRKHNSQPTCLEEV